MKKFLVASIVLAGCTQIHAQGLKGLLSKATSGESSKSTGILKSSSTTGLSNADIVAGLKDALSVGSNKAA